MNVNYYQRYVKIDYYRSFLSIHLYFSENDIYFGTMQLIVEASNIQDKAYIHVYIKIIMYKHIQGIYIKHVFLLKLWCAEGYPQILENINFKDNLPFSYMSVFFINVISFIIFINILLVFSKAHICSFLFYYHTLCTFNIYALIQ